MSKEKHHNSTNHRREKAIARNKSKKTEQIVEFCLLIRELMPSPIESIQPNETYQNLLLELPIEERKLTKLLIHHLSQLYQHHRVQRKGKIIEVADEDVLTALKIIESITTPAEEQSPFSKSDMKHYQKLLQQKNKLMTRLEVEQRLQLSKTQANQLLNQLIEQGLVIRYGFGNKGYRYQILELEEDTLKEDNPQSLEEEIEEDFKDNQRIDYGYH